MKGLLMIFYKLHYIFFLRACRGTHEICLENKDHEICFLPLEAALSKQHMKYVWKTKIMKFVFFPWKLLYQNNEIGVDYLNTNLE
jgi:hypothetical protein